MHTARSLPYGGLPHRPPPVDRQTPVKTLPSQNSFAGGNEEFFEIQKSFCSDQLRHTPSYCIAQEGKMTLWAFVCIMTLFTALKKKTNLMNKKTKAQNISAKSNNWIQLYNTTFRTL